MPRWIKIELSPLSHGDGVLDGPDEVVAFLHDSAGKPAILV